VRRSYLKSSTRLGVVALVTAALAACTAKEAPRDSARADSTAAGATPANSLAATPPSTAALPGALTKPIDQYTGDEFFQFVQRLRWGGGAERLWHGSIRLTAGTLSKRGQFQIGVKNLEIHIKDKARFPGQWAFFKSDDGRAPGTLQPQSATCYSCHQAHGAVDTTFVQFYPTLFPIAKEKGTLSANYLKESAAK